MSKRLFKFRLGASEVEVILDPFPRDMKDEDMADCLTTIHGSTIRLKGWGGRMPAMALLHELLHHWDDSYGIGLGEKRIRCLEQVLAEFIQRNPRIIDTLIKELRK